MRCLCGPMVPQVLYSLWVEDSVLKFRNVVFYSYWQGSWIAAPPKVCYPLPHLMGWDGAIEWFSSVCPIEPVTLELKTFFLLSSFLEVSFFSLVDGFRVVAGRP